MKHLSDGKIVLRDFSERDIEKRVYWETVETEWQNWDAPWEYENLSEEDRKKALSVYIEAMRGWAETFSVMPEEEKRTKFQIAVAATGEYIGWCASYRIDEEGNISENGEKCAVGIDLPALSARGKGYAFSALRLFVGYLLENGEKEIYTQTWSGNFRMIGLAEKLGFEEYRRRKDFRAVKGKNYDALTFRLNLEKFRAGGKEKRI